MTVSQYVTEAHRCADMMKPIDTYTYLFLETEGDPKAKEIVKSNEEQAEKSKGLIRRAIELIKATYEKIRAVLANIKDSITMKSDERAEYEKFCEEMRNNPEFKGKKITVKNWRLINSEYEKLVNEISSEIEKAKHSNEALKPSVKEYLMNKLKKFGELTKNITTQVSIEEVITKAKQDKEFAQNMDIIINGDIANVDKILSGIDQADAQRLASEVHKAANMTWLRQRLADLRFNMTSAKALAEKETRQQMKALKKGVVKGVNKTDGVSNEVVDIGIKAAKQASKEVLSDRKQIKNNKRAIKRINKIEKAEKKESIREDKRRIKREEINEIRRHSK